MKYLLLTSFDVVTYMLVVFLLIARKCYKSLSYSPNSGPYYCSQQTFFIRCFKLWVFMTKKMNGILKKWIF